MLIRINQQVNVDTYANFDSATGGLGGRVRPQDIFVINTRFEKSTPALATQLATNLRAAFPCNRIIALNGMSLDPTVPGYAFTLLDHPAVYSLMTDFEPMDWNGGRASDPGRPPWNHNFKVAYPRVKQWDGRLAASLAANPLGAGKRSLGGRHLGPLSVQIQDACANRGAGGYSSRVKTLFDQYKFKFITKTVKRKGKGKGKKRKITIRRKLKKQARPSLNNLSLQVSFSDTPNPSAGMAITKTSAATAAACARAGLKRGGGAIFFFASDDSMRLLFKQPEISSLRPLPLKN